MSAASWKQRPEGGGRFALGLIRAIGRYGGRTVARLLLHPITLYFLLRRAPERRASIQFLTRALGRPARLRDGARHIHAFASTILDRIFLLQGDMRRFDIRIHGLDLVEPVLDRGQGMLLFGSHLGSFEVLRVLSRRRPATDIRVVLDKGHNPALTQLLDDLDPAIALGIIDGGQDGPSLMLAIQQAVEAGSLVALLVDRVYPGQSSVEVSFLGHPAPLPQAPWLVAAVLKVPVMLAFGLYRGGNRYDVIFEAFSDGVQLTRQQRATGLPALIRGYAARLEHHARQAPYNWFNFYDFWTDGDAERTDEGARGHQIDGPAGRDGGRHDRHDRRDGNAAGGVGPAER